MILDEIVANKRNEVEEAKARLPLSDLEKQISHAPPVKSFQEALDRPGRMRLIAEIKRASPSAGVLNDSLQPDEHALKYRRAGADALSVLTDHRYFKGTLDDLKLAAGAAQLPALRKDFIIDPYQIFEARVYGASAILLIARILDASLIQQFLNEARRLGMCALLEVHDESDLEIALKTDARLIGINNRNLDTLEINLETTHTLITHIPKDRVVVSESGISTPEQVLRLRDAGVSALLVGESILRATDPGQKVRDLLGTA